MAFQAVEDFTESSLPSYFTGDLSDYTINDADNELTWTQTTTFSKVVISTDDTTLGPSNTPIVLTKRDQIDRGAGFCFGVQTLGGYEGESSTTFEGYYLSHKNGPDFRLAKVDGGTETELATVTPDSATENYVRLRLTTWDSNGNIEAEIVDGDGTTLGSLSATDTTYGSGGYGFYMLTAFNGVTPMDSLEADITSPTPSAPTNLSLNVQ